RVRRAADSVFGREQCDEPYARGVVEQVDGARPGAVLTRVVRYQADSLVPQEMKRVAQQHFHAGQYISARCRDFGGAGWSIRRLVGTGSGRGAGEERGPEQCCECGDWCARGVRCACERRSLRHMGLGTGADRWARASLAGPRHGAFSTLPNRTRPGHHGGWATGAAGVSCPGRAGSTRSPWTASIRARASAHPPSQSRRRSFVFFTLLIVTFIVALLTSALVARLFGSS